VGPKFEHIVPNPMEFYQGLRVLDSAFMVQGFNQIFIGISHGEF